MRHFILSLIFFSLGMILAPNLMAGDDGDKPVRDSAAGHCVTVILVPPDAPVLRAHGTKSAKIEAMYLPSMKGLLIGCDPRSSVSTIELENMSTGEYGQMQVNGPMPMLYLQTSGTTGQWRVSVETGNGKNYVGEYSIQ
ncbi:MAG: hypothetical protein K6E35_05320 [Bacteroidales bacterium]|nr:hypothetical protein [Bacteroidales bacterium]